MISLLARPDISLSFPDLQYMTFITIRGTFTAMMYYTRGPLLYCDEVDCYANSRRVS